MSLNQRLVTINHDGATRDNHDYWAPFLLGAARAGATLHFAENASDLHKSLSERAFATPFRWSFGDGTTARGLTVDHRYDEAGWYKIDVSYYYTPQRRWVAFDSAQLQIPGTASKDTAFLSGQTVRAIGAAGIGLGALGVATLALRRRPPSWPVRTPREVATARTSGRARRPTPRRG